MGALMRAKDWSATDLGPVSAWPQSLRTALGIMLENTFPMYIAWGRGFTQFYNDGYRPILGSTKHPAALGIGTRETFAEIWEIIGPMFEGVMEGRPATHEDFLLPLDRHGFPEECYFTFSYSPIRAEGGGVGGVLVTVTETTRRVLGERRLRTLRDLASGTADARTPVEACRRAAAVLFGNAADLPSGALYLPGKAGSGHEMACAFGAAAGRLHPEDARLAAALDEAAGTGRPVELAPEPYAEEGPAGRVVLPIARAGETRPAGLAVMSLSPRLAWDEDYRGFLELAAGQIATALASARSLQEARERAEALAELDRAKTRFFGNVSHEFRTPLTLILGPVQDMLDSPAAELSPGNRERAEVLRRNARRLLKLVNTLLDFSRAEAGRLEASYEPLDLGRVTADLASVFRSAAEKAGLVFAVDCPPSGEWAWVDRDMWEKIVLNLLSNAVKYTREGSVRVTLRETEGAFELEVADTGIGIPDEDQARVFERFHRVRGARGRTHEGTGIGLSLVQELARLHGGEVRLRSRPGEGSAFTVRVPKGYAHLPAERIWAGSGPAPTGVSAQAFLDELPFDPPASGAVPAGPMQGARPAAAEAAAGTTGPEAAEPAPPEGRVLLVDDNPDMREYLRRLLAGRVAAVEAVADGEAALAAIAREVPDLILSDVMMPVIDGFGLLAAVRARKETAGIPFILLSARAGEGSAVDGLAAGADDYLVKPFSAGELRARVEGHLKLARLRREAAANLRLAAAAAEGERARILGLLMEAPAAICSLRGPDHVYEFANPPYQRIVGGRALLGRPIREALPELAGQGLADILDRVYATGEPFSAREFPVRLDRGRGLPEETFFTFTYQPLRGPGGEVQGVLVFAFDVTPHVSARRSLERAGARLAGQKELLERLAQGARLPEILETLTRLCEEQCEGSRASVLLLDPDGMRLRHGAAPGLPADYVAAIDGLAIGDGVGSCGTAAATGRPAIVEDIALDPKWEGWRELALGHGLRACWSVPILTSGGKVLGTFALYHSTPRNPSPDDLEQIGMLASTAALAIERKRSEEALQQVQTRLLQSQKMEAVGQMAGGIAHEFNNLLTAINGYTDLLLALHPEDDPEGVYLREVRSSGERAAALTRRILAFARKQILAPRLLDLNALIGTHLPTLRQFVGGDIELRFRPDPALRRVKADPGQIEQVLLNLVLNARDAMPRGGGITVATTNSGPASDAPEAASWQATQGGCAVLTVADEGEGMDPRVLERIFEPFFTTKEVGRGTGLGLSMVDGIVKQSGGWVEVASEPGRGSTFRVYLPAAGGHGEDNKNGEVRMKNEE